MQALIDIGNFLTALYIVDDNYHSSITLGLEAKPYVLAFRVRMGFIHTTSSLPNIARWFRNYYQKRGLCANF